MEFEVWLFVALLVAAVLVIIKLANEKQKIALRLLIILFVFLAITLSIMGIREGVNLRDFDSVTDLLKTYFVWLGGIFNNLVGITGYAIKQDWAMNATG